MTLSSRPFSTIYQVKHQSGPHKTISELQHPHRYGVEVNRTVEKGPRVVHSGWLGPFTLSVDSQAGGHWTKVLQTAQHGPGSSVCLDGHIILKGPASHRWSAEASWIRRWSLALGV